MKVLTKNQLRDLIWRRAAAARNEQAEVERVFSLCADQSHLRRSCEEILTQLGQPYPVPSVILPTGRRSTNRYSIHVLA
jgi:hypothetical protein